MEHYGQLFDEAFWYFLLPVLAIAAAWRGIGAYSRIMQLKRLAKEDSKTIEKQIPDLTPIEKEVLAASLMERAEKEIKEEKGPPPHIFTYKDFIISYRFLNPEETDFQKIDDKLKEMLTAHPSADPTRFKKFESSLGIEILEMQSDKRTALPSHDIDGGEII